MVAAVGPCDLRGVEEAGSVQVVEYEQVTMRFTGVVAA
jgi:hypothetical protein